jgi:hypothetical protein
MLLYIKSSFILPRRDRMKTKIVLLAILSIAFGCNSLLSMDRGSNPLPSQLVAKPVEQAAGFRKYLPTMQDLIPTRQDFKVYAKEVGFILGTYAATTVAMETLRYQLPRGVIEIEITKLRDGIEKTSLTQLGWGLTNAITTTTYFGLKYLFYGTPRPKNKGVIAITLLMLPKTIWCLNTYLYRKLEPQ